jgi:hypothetical protein
MDYIVRKRHLQCRLRSAGKCSESRGYLSVYSERSVSPTHQHQHAELVTNGDFAVGDEDRVGKRPEESRPVSNSKRHEFSPWGLEFVPLCFAGMQKTFSNRVRANFQREFLR